MKLLLITLLLIFIAGCATTVDHGVALYEQGRYDEAANQWNPLAQAGNPYAQHNLGLLWEYGHGSTPRNHEEAAGWYLLAANQGLVISMVRLAKLQLRHGHDENAISWLNLAARWGDEEAVSILNGRELPIPEPDLYVQNQRAQQQERESDSSGWANAFILGAQLYNASQGVSPTNQNWQSLNFIGAAPDVCNCIGYSGPGGRCYAGPGGPAYNGPGGPAYAGPGGPCYSGPGGPMYDGPGGPAYRGPGGSMYDGPGGPAYRGPGGPAYDGPGGPCYSGPGGPCFTGPGSNNRVCPTVCGIR